MQNILFYIIVIPNGKNTLGIKILPNKSKDIKNVKLPLFDKIN